MWGAKTADRARRVRSIAHRSDYNGESRDRGGGAVTALLSLKERQWMHEIMRAPLPREHDWL
jgi:hypothetical protein